jgi:Raf kinase inhibitor-like YbhB/YbcL family protein
VREFALVCLDYDVPKPQPIVHWLMYRISPATRSLPAHIPIEGDLGAPLSAYQGANTHGDYGFMGPKPPKEDPPHRYVFRLFALDRPSYAEPGLSKDEFFKKIKGHILEEAELIGFYQYEGVDAHEGLLEKAKAAVTHMFHHSH